ncbi:MAG: thiamine diphosphokinase [Ilumatobacteraceae bacterium]
MNDTVIVITGADPLHPDAIAAIPAGAVVIAADGGLDHALAAGLQPVGVVGDMDSITDEGLAWAAAHARLERHDPDKDHTDTELALEMAADMNPGRLIMVSGGGDRLDHTIAAIGALGRPWLTSIPSIEGWWGRQHVHVLHGPATAHIELDVGTTISLIATHGPCTGVGIDGVQWPLELAELAGLSGRGVSNVTTEPDIDIRVSTGILTVFVSHQLVDGQVDGQEVAS